jgi:hypothetical protein
VDRGEPVRRVGDRDIDANLIEALVQQPGQHRGRAIERVARRDPPPRDPHERHLAPLRGREHLREPSAVDHEIESLDDRRIRELDEDVAHKREVFDDVPVAVDDRVVDLTTDLGDLGAAFVRGHSEIRVCADPRCFSRPPTAGSHSCLRRSCAHITP